MYTKEAIKSAEEIDIVDYCEQNGIDLKRDSGRYYRLIDHDSCVIDRKKNSFYWNSRSIGGNTINFVREIEGVNFKDAMKRLLDNDTSYIENKAVEFVNEPYVYSSEKEVPRFDKARDYLANERKIDTSLIDNLHDQGLIKQDKYNNVLFLWKDYEQIMGCSEQGVFKSDKYKRGSWKKIQSNSTENYGFNVLNGEPKNLKFFESSIDLLSYASLNKKNLQDTHLISMEGLKHGTVLNYVVKAKERIGDAPDSVSFCVDNDKAGLNFIDKFKSLEIKKKDGQTYDFTIELPNKPGKEVKIKWDWNDQLKYTKQRAVDLKRQQLSKNRCFDR